nr:hypothetical protein HEP87_26455 [Streptomyces sp. S1D4-11]
MRDSGKAEPAQACADAAETTETACERTRRRTAGPTARPTADRPRARAAGHGAGPAALRRCRRRVRPRRADRHRSAGRQRAEDGAHRGDAVLQRVHRAPRRLLPCARPGQPARAHRRSGARGRPFRHRPCDPAEGPGHRHLHGGVASRLGRQPPGLRRLHLLHRQTLRDRPARPRRRLREHRRGHALRHRPLLRVRRSGPPHRRRHLRPGLRVPGPGAATAAHRLVDPGRVHRRAAAPARPLRARQRPGGRLRPVRPQRDPDQQAGTGPAGAAGAARGGGVLPGARAGAGAGRPRARRAAHRLPRRHLGRRRARVRRDPGPRGDGLLRTAPAVHGGLAGRPRGPAHRPVPVGRAAPRGRRQPLLPPRPRLGHRPGRHRRLPVLARPRLLGRAHLHLVRPTSRRQAGGGAGAAGGGGGLAALDRAADARGGGGKDSGGGAGGGTGATDGGRLGRPRRRTGRGGGLPSDGGPSDGGALDGGASDDGAPDPDHEPSDRTSDKSRGKATNEASGQASDKASDETDRYRRALRRSVLVEVVVGVVVLVITTLLTGTQPGRAATEAAAASAIAAAGETTASTTTIPFDVGTKGGHGKVQIELTPSRVGENSVQAVIYGPDGGFATVPELRLTFTLESQQLGPIDAELTDKGGYWAADGVTLPVAGTWTMKVTVRTTDIDQVTVSKTVKIG